jgi:GNAT superfamily N-acetyltransferase
MDAIAPTRIEARRFADMIADTDFPALMREYAAESSIDGMPPPAMHVDTYLALEAAGHIHVFCAYRGGHLVGFLAMLVSLLPHYSALAATTESWFVSAAARKGGTGKRLMDAAEAKARELGAVGFLISAPTGGSLERAAPMLGYRETNRVYFKALQ